MRILGTILAGLLGLAFGSFLNVCLSRWPAGESVVKPRSHCRACGRTLAWWENVPLVSWLVLRGKCRTCGAWIGVRYVVVEAAIGAIWAYQLWVYLGQFLASDTEISLPGGTQAFSLSSLLASMVFCLLLVGIAALDAEHFWIADAITLPGIFLGLFSQAILSPSILASGVFWRSLGWRLFTALATAGLIVIIRWLYWLVRRKEGLGLGDAKLMILLSVWLGLPGALLAFFLGVVLGAVAAVVILFMRKRDAEAWASTKLPLGTFLCIGGIVSSLWGSEILSAYLRWARF